MNTISKLKEILEADKKTILSFISTIRNIWKIYLHNCKQGYSKYLNPLSLIRAHKELKEINREKAKEGKNDIS